LTFSKALPIANVPAPRGSIDGTAVVPQWRDAAAASTRSGRQCYWLRALVRRLDDALRRLYGVREFSDRPDCLLRIAIGRALDGIRLADGSEIPRGSAIIELHLWNEHLSTLLSSRGNNLGWANALRRRVDASLGELADCIASDPFFAGVNALRARIVLVSRRRLPKLIRVARAFGFETVASDAPEPFGTRVHGFWENFFIRALVWTFNPTALRRAGLRRVRCEVWIPRDALLARYRRPLGSTFVEKAIGPPSCRSAVSRFVERVTAPSKAPPSIASVPAGLWPNPAPAE
jgi:hypothetical protein